MRKWIIAVLAAAILVSGCVRNAPAPRPEKPAAPERNLTRPDEPFYVLADRYGLSFVAGGDDTSTVLPVDVDADPQWGVVQSVVAKNGYDLKPYAGQSVRIFTQPLQQRWEGARTTFVALVHDGKTIAAYAYAEDYIPGVLALSEVGHPAAASK